MGITLVTRDQPEYQEKYRQREPHRCNDRVEDFCKVLTGGWAQVPDNFGPAFKTMWKCYLSKEGEEPHEPYRLLSKDEKFFKDHAKLAAEAAERQQAGSDL